MSDRRRYKIVREAVAVELCGRAVEEVTRALVVGENEASLEYEPTPTCTEIARSVHQVREQRKHR